MPEERIPSGIWQRVARGLSCCFFPCLGFRAVRRLRWLLRGRRFRSTLDHLDFRVARVRLLMTPYPTEGVRAVFSASHLTALGDVDNDVIRLRPENSKNGEGRILVLTHELLAIIKRARVNRRLDCPYVFHYEGGKPIGDFKKSWHKACRAAGLSGDLLLHDLRRSGVRNMVRAGTPERVAMARSGHKTRAMLDRYNIVSEIDLRKSAEMTGDWC